MRNNILFITLFLVGLLSVLSACGGGTTGTGGTGSTIQGRLLSSIGQPVISALLTIEETGDSSLTDNEGGFQIETQLESTAVTLLIEKDTASATAVLDELTSDTETVTVELELDTDKNSAKVTSKKITKKRKPTPTSTAVPTITLPPSPSITPAVPTQTPAPTETQIIEPTVTSTAVPEITAHSTPTPTPTNTPTWRTRFVGEVRSTDPFLLLDTTIGVPLKGRHIVNTDGTFAFSEKAASDNTIIVIRYAGEVARFSVPAITELAKRVNLTISLERLSSGRLKATLTTLGIIERSPNDIPLDTGAVEASEVNDDFSVK